MNKIGKTCYMCEKLATSVEHVPPRCLFPEKKDLPDGVDLRKQLLTIPACDEHNSQKSQDDEYFLYSLVMLSNSNNVSRNLYFSKIKRAIKRNPSLFKKFAETASPIRIQNSITGKISNTHALHFDEDRFNGIIHKLGRAIYFKHFNEKWQYHMYYQAEYLLATLDPEKTHDLNEPIQMISEQMDQLFLNSEYYGENPEVFKYQVIEDNQSKMMRLYFYEGCKLLLIFTEGNKGGADAYLGHKLHQK